jgi:hypothetical protein
LVAEEVLADTTNAVRFLVAGMKKERAKWRAAEGRFSAQWRVVNMPVDNTARGYVAFDGGLDRGRLRWDWEGPGTVVRPESERPVGSVMSASTQWGHLKSYYAVNEAQTASYRSDGTLVAVRQTEQLGWRHFAAQAAQPAPVDLWGFCLYDAGDRKKDFDAVVEELVAYSSQLKSARVVKQPDGKWRFEFYYEDYTRDMFTYIIDVDRGFTPVAYRHVQQRSEKTLQVIEERWQQRRTLSKQEQEKLARVREYGARPLLTVEKSTSWAQVNDVWVPVKHEYRRSTPEQSEEEEGFTFEFTWESVNQEIAPRVFSYEGFSLEPTVPVYDYGKQTLLRGELPRRSVTSAPLTTRWATLVCLLIGLTLVSVAAAVWLVRRIRPGRRRVD